jgi:hypothetical protein
MIASGCSGTDIKGEVLTKDRLAGSLTKLASYRGTSCSVDVADYAIRRINGLNTPEVERAVTAVEEAKKSVRELMTLLEPRDFETLVDSVFSTSGWRRLGRVGGTQKTLDLDLILPSTGKTGVCSGESRTTSAELAEYVAKMEDHGPYDRMFFVFHSGDASADDDRVSIVGPEKLADPIIDAGLMNWLIRKVS